jgi:hypothetical protein
MRKLIPNYNRFNFDAFIEGILDQNFHEMYAAINSECRRVEESMRGRGGPQARLDGGVEYVARLKRVAFWFYNGLPVPDGREATTCRRIAERLIAKGEIKPEALDAFRHRDSN